MKFYAHPLVQGLIRTGRGPDPTKDPEAVGELVAQVTVPLVPAFTDGRLCAHRHRPRRRGDAEEGRRREGSGNRGADRARCGKPREPTQSPPNAKLSEALLALYRSTGEDAAAFKHAAEQWFDDSMERVSGWYRRKIQFLLFVIGTIVVCLLNADTLTTGRVLWRDDASRAAVVTKRRQRRKAKPAISRSTRQ